jgi:hypothetical protein
MRVAVHHPARTEPDGTEIPESVCAYKLGRVQDHTDVLTGKTTSAGDVAELFVEQAKAEFPGCFVVIERLVDNGDGTSKWVHVDEVPEGAVSPEGTTVKAPELAVAQEQQTAPGGAQEASQQ